MSLIDHLSVGVADLAEARAFYDPVLATLDCGCLAENARFAAYGRDKVAFLVMPPFNKDPAGAGNGTHICFAAPSRAAVDAFHAAGLLAGGTDEGAPGPRPAYPTPDAYAAYVRDPFGNKLEAIHGGFVG